jgi:hypothetical protein
MESGCFPADVNFEAVNCSRIFSSKLELAKFIEEERRFWIHFGSTSDNMLSGPPRINADLLPKLLDNHDVGDNHDDRRLIEEIQEASEKFIPHSLGSGKIFEVAFKAEPEVARIAFALVHHGNQLPVATNNPKYVHAQAIRYIFIHAGEAIGKMRQNETSVENLHSSESKYESARVKCESFLEFMQKEWKTRIEGYESKVALASPRTYWDERSTQHREKSRSYRLTWHISMVVFSVISIAALALAVSDARTVLFSDPPGEFGWAVGALRNIIVVGTLLGLGLWWIRQVLKDMRRHEHLAEDAAERVTMIETYAALRGVGVDEGDLSTILSALYRPAASALVDDGGPTLPLEILLKGVSEILPKQK